MAKRAALACGAVPVHKFSDATDRAEHLEQQPRRPKNELISEFKETLTFSRVRPEDVEAITD